MPARNRAQEKWLKELEESTKTKYADVDKHIEAYKKLRDQIEEIFDLHPLHDGNYHHGNSTGPIACRFDEINDYIVKLIKELKKKVA
jgi:hypothetical protein